MKIAILGASGHGKVVADALLQIQNTNSIVFFDDNFPNVQINGNWPVIGNTIDLIDKHKEFDGVVVAIGNNNIRWNKQKELVAVDAQMMSVLHPKAVISPYAKIGIGVVILAGAVVNAFADVGDACIINSNAVVEHDVKLCNSVHICPGVNVAGGVVIGQESWIGIGSCVKQLLQIGNSVVVGAGSVVVKNIPDHVTVIGSPAKLMR
jgi:sugar O-acyltransferase (sialic acid O-acetyltransferase NeuD family)